MKDGKDKKELSLTDNGKSTLARRRSQELALAFMLINTPDTIAEEILMLKKIARDGRFKARDRINAIKTIWQYALPKPRAEVDLTSKGDKLTNVLVEFVDGEIVED